MLYIQRNFYPPGQETTPITPPPPSPPFHITQDIFVRIITTAIMDLSGHKDAAAQVAVVNVQYILS